MTNIDVVTMQDLWKKDSEGYIPILIDIYNPDIGWTDEERSVYGQINGHLRFISDENKVIYKNAVYLPCAFDYTPPDTDGKKIGAATISISAIDSRVKKMVRTIKTPSEVNVVAMFAKIKRTNGKTTFKFAEMKSASFWMTAASSNKATATFNLSFDRALSQNVPFDMATSDRVPGTSA